MVGFGPQPNTVLIITAKGGFYKCSFDPNVGGACSQDWCVGLGCVPVMVLLHKMNA